MGAAAISAVGWHAPHPKTSTSCDRSGNPSCVCPAVAFLSAMERDPKLVRQDVLNGYVSVQAARSDYGGGSARDIRHRLGKDRGAASSRP